MGMNLQRFDLIPESGPISSVFGDFRVVRCDHLSRKRSTATANLAAVKRALEHRDIRTTLQYAHVPDEDVRAALDASESRTIPKLRV